MTCLNEHLPGTTCMKCGEPVLPVPAGGERWLLLYDADLDSFVEPLKILAAPEHCVYGRVCAGCLVGVPRRLRILAAI